MEKLLNSVQKYVMLVVVVLSGTVYGADTDISRVPLSEKARGYLVEGPILHVGSIKNPDGSSQDVIFDKGIGKEILISICDNLSEEQIDIVLNSALSEMQAIFLGLEAGVDSARSVFEELIRRHPLSGQSGIPFFKFICRWQDPDVFFRCFANIGSYSGGSDFHVSIEDLEGKKHLIGLCIFTLAHLIRDFNCHQLRLVSEDNFFDDVTQIDKQEYDDMFYRGWVYTFTSDAAFKAVKEAIASRH